MKNGNVDQLSKEFGEYLKEQFELSSSFSDLRRRVRMNRDTLLRLFLIHDIKYPAYFKKSEKKLESSKQEENSPLTPQKKTKALPYRGIYLKPHIIRGKKLYFAIVGLIVHPDGRRKFKTIKDSRLTRINESIVGIEGKEELYKKARAVLLLMREEFNLFQVKGTFIDHSAKNLRKVEKAKKRVEKILSGDKPSHSTSELKRLLYTSGIKKPCCEICNIKKWCRKTISFHLDHINGDHYDNSLTNLRILCPNCHSQTPTYTGKKRS